MTDPPNTFTAGTTLLAIGALKTPAAYSLGLLSVSATTVGPTSNIYYTCSKSQSTVTPTGPTLTDKTYDKGTSTGDL